MLFFAFALGIFSATSAVSLPHLSESTQSPGVLESRANISNPAVAKCGPSSANIVCMNNHAAVLPPSFSRDPNPAVNYAGTQVPDDVSWQLLSNASFQIFDENRGLDVLGPSPKIEKVFDVLNVIHEAPVYVPKQNKLYLTQAGPPGNLSALVIDLNVNPPKLSTFDTTPKTYQPNGAVLHNGMIYWAVMGNNVSLPGGLKQRPGIARLDPATGQVETLLNNYYGFFFSGPNDITVDSSGDIWFTDSGKYHASANLKQGSCCEGLDN